MQHFTVHILACPINLLNIYLKISSYHKGQNLIPPIINRKRSEVMRRSPEETRKIMSKIRSRNTKPELILRKELWRRGLRYRSNVRTLPGVPDIVFSRVKLAVFCDGDFWHGFNWTLRGYQSLEDELSRYNRYWASKIRRNVARDSSVNQILHGMGWTVLRMRESEIKKDVKQCGDKVEYAYRNLLRNIASESEEFSVEI